MPLFGSFALLLALVLSAYCLLFGAVALRRQVVGIPSDRLAETARRAGIATWIAVSGAAFALVWAALNNDFSVAYIFHHSNRDLPTPYKFAALWSGQEGSLLFWALLLSSYGLVLRLRHRVDVKLTAYASTILAAVQLFFLLLLNFAATPFSLVRGAIPPDGNGLNPLLQYPEMVIHPPMLYLGYVGFAVPFAFALGMLKTWNVWLIFCTFLLSILGTFLTRSGVVSSVHAFAQSSIGGWFLWFMGITFVVCLFFYVRNRDHLRSEHRLESLLSRESSFLFQNLVLLASCFAVLWGTLFPILSEWIQGHKVTVGPPFFNRVNIPIALFLLLLTGVGPLLAWRSTSWARLKRNFTA